MDGWSPQRILHREGWEGDYAQLLRNRRRRQQQQQQRQQRPESYSQLQRGAGGGGRAPMGAMGAYTGAGGRRIEALEVEGEQGGGQELQQPFTASWAAVRLQGAR